MEGLTLRPKPANQLAPRLRMVGATATVSTFVTVVGQPKTPTLAGNGGFRRGLPWRPCGQRRQRQRRQKGNLSVKPRHIEYHIGPIPKLGNTVWKN